jgi:DNA-binding MarR family transcriptional regulator
VTPRRPKNPTPGLNPGVAAPYFEAWRSFVQAYGAVFWLVQRDLTDEVNLPAAWYEVLLHVNNGDEGRIDLSDLEDLIAFSQSGLSQLISRMHASGLVERCAHESDGRRTLVEITDEGLAVLTEAAAVHRRSIERHFADHMSSHDATVIARTMNAVLTAANAERSQRRAAARPIRRTATGR